MCRVAHARDKGQPNGLADSGDPGCYLFTSGSVAGPSPFAPPSMTRLPAAGTRAVGNAGAAETAPVSRRGFLSVLAQSTAALAAAPLVASLAPARLFAEAQPVTELTPIVVYKDASCGCCRAWVQHMKTAGYKVTAHDVPDMDSVKKTMGVPAALASCHTAVAGNYLIEGHVPADVVKRVLLEKPVARGLAVPGMPAGSPGMEGGTKEKYNVILFERSGKTRVYDTR